MLTLTLQSVLVLLFATFSVLTVRVAHALRNEPGVHRSGWVISGVMFSISAAILLIQGAWGIAAYMGGSGSAVLAEYLRYAPIANHSRTLLMLAFWGALTILALRQRFSNVDQVVLASAAVVALVVGGVLGYLEGTLSAISHFPRTAVLDTLSFVVLAGVLFLLMIRDTIDRYLWSALAVYGFTSVFSVIFLSAMAWLDTDGAWTPPSWAIHAMRVALASGMVAIVHRRLQLARRGTRVQGLLPPPRRRLTLT
jgi:hypothetical protein